MWGKLAKQFIYRNEYSNLVLRKTKSFNKSRYSRNRQYYRTGVYWCLWLNIILVFALYYVFYRYTFKFSYIFIFYILSSILCLFSFFSKNYFLGFSKSIDYFCEQIAFDIILISKVLLSNIFIFIKQLRASLWLVASRNVWLCVLFASRGIPYAKLWENNAVCVMRYRNNKWTSCNVCLL